MSLMPVAKKTTNNKTNKKVSLIQKLKLNTLKGRMLATVLVFALIGGGVMVYRSFAAVSTGVYKQYIISPDTFIRDGAQVNIATTGSNGKAATYKIDFSRNSFIMTKEEILPPQGNYFFCFNYTAASDTNISFNPASWINASQAYPGSPPQSINLPKASAYTRTCKSIIISNPGVWKWSMTNYSTVPISINSISLETSSAAGTPPAPVK